MRKRAPARRMFSPVPVRLLLAGLLLTAVSLIVLPADAARRSGPAARPYSCDPATSIDSCFSLPTSASPEARLAQKFAPLLYLKDQTSTCDTSGEAFAPLPVTAVLGNPAVALRLDDGSLIKYAPTPADLYAAGRGAHLDFPGDPAMPGCAYERDASALQASNQPVAYVHVATELGHPGLALQYWFFYYFNYWTDKHEGDWEMVQLDFAAGSVSQALHQDPVRVTYAQHNGAESAAWDSSTFQREGSHPVVFASSGSHASELGSGVYIGRGENWSGVGCDDTSGPSHAVRLQTLVLPDHPVGPTDPNAWLGFTGAWGDKPGGELDGPTGPNRKWQWWAPFSWENERARPSIEAPGPSLGPNVVNDYCKAVRLASGVGFPVLTHLPPLPRGPFAALGLGAFGVGAVSSITWSRVSSISESAKRRRRSLLRSAMSICLARPLLFATIGLLALPLAALSLALKLPAPVIPFRPLIDVPGAGATVRLIEAVAFGQLEFGLPFALSCVVATAFVVADNERRGVRAGLRLAAHRLPGLLLARLAATVIVVALALTVVGLPLAVWLAARWLFVEQSVLLGNHSWREGLDESSAIVAGCWLSSLLMTSALKLIAVGGVPFLGIVMMLAFQGIPLVYVNLAVAVLYALLVPFVAVALALLYLQLREESPQADVRWAIAILATPGPPS